MVILCRTVDVCAGLCSTEVDSNDLFKITDCFHLVQDVVLMCEALEKAFREKLNNMPPEVCITFLMS